MAEDNVLNYILHDLVELNLSYMPFISDGGMFVPSDQNFILGEKISLVLHLPGQEEILNIEGKIIWITPKNALHHVVSGVGIQFVGPHASTIKNKIESILDKKVEIGGYLYGISEKGQ